MRLIAFAVVLVLAAGGLIAVGLLAAMGNGESPTCGQLRLGAADDIRQQLDNSGAPIFNTGGGRCGFWLALEGGDIVAYKLNVPGRDCTVRYRNDRYTCGGETIPTEDLAQYPTSIVTIDGIDTLIVDLRSAEQRRNAATTTT